VDRPDYAQYEVWGNQILHATAFSIILSAPIGLLVIALLGPVWLKEVRPSQRFYCPSCHEWAQAAHACMLNAYITQHMGRTTLLCAEEDKLSFLKSDL